MKNKYKSHAIKVFSPLCGQNNGYEYKLAILKKVTCKRCKKIIKNEKKRGK